MRVEVERNHFQARPAQALALRHAGIPHLDQLAAHKQDPPHFVSTLARVAIRTKDLHVGVRIIGGQAPGDDVVDVRVPV